MADYQFIQYGVADGLARLAIDRPPLNVLDIPTMAELNDALDRCLADDTVKLLMLTGVGDKAFSAGVEVADHTPDKVERMIEVFHGIFRRLQRMPVPTLAAVNGAALGGGMSQPASSSASPRSSWRCSRRWRRYCCRAWWRRHGRWKSCAAART